MRKELLWAIFAGIFFGIIIAFGVWRANSSFKPKNENTKSSPTPNSKNSFKIVLNTPENEDVVTDATVEVSGITAPLSWITFSAEDSDYTIQADDKGNFKEDIDLIPGVNQIKVTAFDQNGRESGTRVLVVYSSAFEKKTEATDNPNGGSSDSAIRAKVEEKVKEALLRPKAYLGVVTDITDSTIQIKSGGGEIKQISVSVDQATVVKSGKEVKLTDIGIGDFIVAMGYKNGNQVLTAQRILITEAVSDPSSKAVYGAVSSIDKKSITIAETVVTPDKLTKIASVTAEKVSKAILSNIEEGNLVIYVTVEASGKTAVRSIFVLQKS